MTAQLDTAKKAAAVESPELKKLRTELANAKADTEKASTAQKAELAKLQQQTKDLTGQLDTAKKVTATIKPDTTANDEELARLRAELANTKTELTSANAATTKPVATGDSEEVKQLRVELARAKADADLAKKIGGKPAMTANEELSQLRPAYARARAEAEEYKRLAARAELDRAERAAMTRHLSDLERTNAQLREQLGSAKPQMVSKATAPIKQPTTSESEKPSSNIVANGKPTAGNEEVAKLRTELTAAKAGAEKARQAASRVSDLERENKMLATQLAEARKVPAATKSAPTVQNFGAAATEEVRPVTKSVESAELKQLRTELANAKTDGEKASQAQKSELAKLQQQTKDLTGHLDAAKKGASVEPPELKKLRMDLAAAKLDTEKAHTTQQAETAKLQQQNSDLTTQLIAAKKTAVTAPVETLELKKASTELADAKTALNKAKNELAAATKANQDELTGLQNKIKALAAELDAAKKPASKSDEIVKLRKQADIAWSEAEKYRQIAKRVDGLENENKLLATQLAEAHKTQALTARPAPQAAQSAGQSLEKQITDLQKQNTELKTQLKKLQPER